MNRNTAKGYLAYALTAMGYDDNKKIDIIGKFGALLNEYLSKFGEQDNMQAKIMVEECRSLAKLALKECGINQIDINIVIWKLNISMRTYSKKSARTYFNRDLFLTYEDQTDIELLEIEDDEEEEDNF